MPTLVSDEETTEAFRVVPVSVPAAAATVIFADPSKATPLMVLAVVSVAADPVVFWFSVGTSATTMARKVGTAAAPEDGPAKNRLALWVARAPVSVPEAVTGEPDTVKMDGNARPTLVTVPEPPPSACHVAVVPLVATGTHPTLGVPVIVMPPMAVELEANVEVAALPVVF